MNASVSGYVNESASKSRKVTVIKSGNKYANVSASEDGDARGSASASWTERSKRI